MDDNGVDHVHIAPSPPSQPAHEPPQRRTDAVAMYASQVQHAQSILQAQSTYMYNATAALNLPSQHALPQHAQPVQLVRQLTPLRVVVFSALPFEIDAFQSEVDLAGASKFIEIIPVQAALEDATASLALGAQVVSVFVTDSLHRNMLHALKACGVQVLAFRYSAARAFNDEMAFELGIRIARPPAHSPTSVAEYTVSLLMTLNRKIHIAHNRVRDGNFRLHGLLGFELSGKTVGIIGTGSVGRGVARILSGFGCRILAFDVVECGEVCKLGGRYVSLKKLFTSSHIISLHAPLMAATRHMIGAKALATCKRGVVIVNTARGALMDVDAVIEGLQSGQVGGLAMDVYEAESSVFYKDGLGDELDMKLEVLKSMPNVLMTGHQSALTSEAVTSVARDLVRCMIQFRMGMDMDYEVKAEAAAPVALT